MRILFVTNRWPSPETPGDSPAIKDQADSIAARGHQVDVLFFNSRSKRSSYAKAALRIVWDVWIRGRYDVVHAHYGFLVGWLARLQWRCPVVVTYRGSDLMWEREQGVSRTLARFVDAVIVMTKPMEDALGRPASIIPYGIDLRIFRPGDRADARKALGLAPTTPYILFPYRTDRAVKRFDLVKEAAQRLKAEFPAVEVVTISDEPNSRVAEFMRACDVMVLASEREGAPVAVREAIACDLPVVSVDVGDAAELIGAIEWCFVVDPGPIDIADKVAEVLRSGQRSNGSAFVRDFDLSKAASKVLDIYAHVVGDRQRPSSPEPGVIESSRMNQASE